jgi:hypothetical protein
VCWRSCRWLMDAGHYDSTLTIFLHISIRFRAKCTYVNIYFVERTVGWNSWNYDGVATDVRADQQVV